VFNDFDNDIKSAAPADADKLAQRLAIRLGDPP